MRSNTFRALLVAALLPATGIVGAQDPSTASGPGFPSKAVRIVVPFPPGGSTDTIGRALAPSLAKSLGQSVIIDNRPGANTIIGAEQALRAPADGYTLFFMAPSFTINPFVQSKLSFDPLRDFTGLTRLVYNPLIICVHPSLPVKTVKDLVALARSRPGELTWAVSSVIGGGRIGGELFKEAAKIDMTVVPYGGGGPAATAVLGGHTSMMVGNVLECVPHANAGRLRPIAVTSAERSPSLPKVPTIAESGYPGFDATNWFGTVIRTGTPRGALDRLNAEMGKSLRRPEVIEAFNRLGMTSAPTTPAEFDAIIRHEMEVNGRLIRKLNLKVD